MASPAVEKAIEGLMGACYRLGQSECYATLQESDRTRAALVAAIEAEVDAAREKEAAQWRARGVMQGVLMP